MPQFKQGDVVELKSGGPDMTVSSTAGNERVECIWFSGNEPKVHTFAEPVLKLVKKSAETSS